jgi:hypothetical protein
MGLGQGGIVGSGVICSTAIIHQITVIGVTSVSGPTAIIHQITVIPVTSVTGPTAIID